ncbi:MAG TPA: hypothetical protein VK338_00585, partial [Candidatus Nitrosocosmicus sp.]|nr:hypothetical protein [Candidatus Nitrosocosmicus sp.]
MKFSRLSEYFKQIEQVSSRIQITTLLSDLFKEIEKDEMEMVVYLLQGRIAPLYKHIDFGMAEKMIMRAIVKSLEVDSNDFLTFFQKKGDLGIAVEELKREKNTPNHSSMTVRETFEKLLEITQLNGQGSQEKKVQILCDLISHLDPLSCRYIVRIPTNTLRLGFSDMTVLDAFSWMITGDKSLRAQIEKMYHVKPDLGEIGEILKRDGVKGLQEVQPSIFTPIIMMRAERLADPQAILEKIGACSIESKFDGFRVQVHFQNGEVK